MDGIGLRNYIINHPRDRDNIRLELADAFASCPDPGALVLDTMSGFSSTNDFELRRSCVMFLEELMEIKTEIKGEAREKAMILAIDCKEMLSSITSINNNTFGLLGFLLLVAVYGLRHAFSVDELMDYVVAVAKNKIAVQLCRLLDFGDNIAGQLDFTFPVDFFCNFHIPFVFFKFGIYCLVLDYICVITWVLVLYSNH